MPTKPPIASPVIATNANYAAGARVGDPTKILHGTPADGWTPGAIDVAEFYNHYVNEFGQWVTNWVSQGTSVGDLNAHIIETDSDGLTSIATVDVGGTGHVTATLGAAFSVTNNTGAGTGSRTALFVADQGRAVEAVNSSSTQPTMYLSNDFSGGGLVLQVQAIDGGKIAEFQAFNDPADGIDVDALGTGKYGAQIRASFDGLPILILDRLTGATPTRGAISMPGQLLAPSAPANNDLWKTAGGLGTSRGHLEWEDAGGAAGLVKGTQRAWSTEGGLGYAQAESIGPNTTTLGTFVNEVTLTIDRAGAPTGTDPNGDYIVEWCALISNSGAGNPEVVLRFVGPGFSRQVNYKLPAIGDDVAVTFRKRFAYAGGLNTWTLDFHSSIAGQIVEISESSIVARGAYE